MLTLKLKDKDVKREQELSSAAIARALSGIVGTVTVAYITCTICRIRFRKIVDPEHPRWCKECVKEYKKKNAII